MNNQLTIFESFCCQNTMACKKLIVQQKHKLEHPSESSENMGFYQPYNRPTHEPPYAFDRKKCLFINMQIIFLFVNISNCKVIKSKSKSNYVIRSSAIYKETNI